MAVLTLTKVTARLPVGDRVMETGRFTIANANAEDEWLPTGLTTIDAIVGIIAIGQADITELPAARKNAQGTVAAENSSHGDLAIEGNAGTYEITYIGKP